MNDLILSQIRNTRRLIDYYLMRNAIICLYLLRTKGLIFVMWYENPFNQNVLRVSMPIDFFAQLLLKMFADRPGLCRGSSLHQRSVSGLRWDDDFKTFD